MNDDPNQSAVEWNRETWEANHPEEDTVPLKIDPPTFRILCDGLNCKAVACERQPYVREAEKIARTLGWKLVVAVPHRWYCPECKEKA